MTILIVDDSEIKINKIKSVIEETQIGATILLAKTKAGAMDIILSTDPIDLIILDLNLPNRISESPKKLAGLNLLKEINKRASINKPNYIIGLTAYKELKIEIESQFIENGWLLLTYDNKTSIWEETIKNKLFYIKSLKSNQKFDSSIINENTKLALIMKGGGIKGLAYVGALEELSKYYSFNWFAGTSSGAVSAILLGAGFEVNELKQILLKKKFSDFKDASILRRIYNLFTKQGLYEAETFNTWLTNELSRKLDSAVEIKLKNLPHRVTVYASRREKKAVIFDSKDESTNSTRAVFAARCSMSIPFFFTPQKEQGINIFDGGAQNNYPVKILLENNPNTKFIGLYLGNEHYQHPKKVSLLREMLSIWTESMDYEALSEYMDETIIINTKPISTLSFNLNENEKNFLLECGRVSAIKFLVKNQKINKEEIDLEKQQKKLNVERNLLIRKKILKNRRKRAFYIFLLCLCVCIFLLR
ncbi:MAG: patatin-like phospholipase family protein [Aequorivita antarctica]